MQDLTDAFIHLLFDTETCLDSSPGQNSTTTLVTFLRNFRLKRLNPIHQRLRRMESGRYVVSLVGLTNVGKSTLAHALLRHPVAPSRNGPATSIPVEYEHGPEWLIKTCELDTCLVRTEHFASSQLLAQTLQQRVIDISPNQAAQIERVLVRGPMDAIEGGIVFVDTPGFGAIQSEDSVELFQNRLTAYVINNVHEVLFCVSSANGAVKTEECKFFQDIHQLCTTVVVTKWDCDPGEQEEAIRVYKSKFAHLFPLCGFIFIEAKWAIDANNTGNIGKLDTSGVVALDRFLRERATINGRRNVARQHLVDAWNDLLELVREPLHECGLKRVPWREDAIHRLRNAANRLSLVLSDLK